MDEIDLYRAQALKHPGFGDWWTPNIKVTEVYQKGPLSTRIGTARTNIEDYKKAALRALMRSSQIQGQPTLSNPKGIPFQERVKELDKAVNDLKEGKITLKEFTSDFPEGNYLKNKGLKPRTSYYQTAKPALKQVAKLAGPLGLAYGAYDYASGTPVADATLDPNYKMVEKPNAFETWYKKTF